MDAITRKKELFENLLRLRRVGRAAPRNRDIAAVRAFLEGELGETVSRRLAAQFLGVSHTALARWIDRGELPVVFTRTGRTEVPVSALLELRESVDDERLTNRRQRHVLEPTMALARRRAERLKPGALVSEDELGEAGHRRAELRSLAYHRALAKRLRRSDVDEALQVLWKWRQQGKIDSYYAEAWERLLTQPMPQVKRALGEDTQHMRDLRQNSPFAGALSEAERKRIFSAVP